MRITLLGSGTSSGVPMIACDCPVCTSDDPRDRRLRVSAMIETVDAEGKYRVILIDAGPDLRQQALRHDIWRCDAILLTHNHVDHVFGLDETRRFNAVMKQAIEVYADRHTVESIRRVYQHIFQPERSVNNSFVASLETKVTDADSHLHLFGLNIKPVPLKHGNLPILGFRIEDTLEGHYSGPVAFCTDVSEIPADSYELLRDLDVLFLDALRPHPHPTHFTLERATEEAKKIAAGQTYFVHMAHSLGHAATEAILPDGINLGYDGLSFGDEITCVRR